MANTFQNDLLNYTDDFATAVNKINDILNQIITTIGTYSSLQAYIQDLSGGMKGSVTTSSVGQVVVHNYNSLSYNVLVTPSADTRVWVTKGLNSFTVYADVSTSVDYVLVNTTTALKLVRDYPDVTQEVVNARNGYANLSAYLQFLYSLAQNGIIAQGLQGLTDVGVLSLLDHVTAPTLAPSVSVSASSGSLSGAYQYAVQYLSGYWTGAVGTGTLNVIGHTEASPLSITVNPANAQVTINNVPTGGTGVVARTVYRTKAGGNTFYLLTQINDNTTTTFTDNTVDSALGAAMVNTNTTGTSLRMNAHQFNILDQSISLPADPTTPMQAVTKQYADAITSKFDTLITNLDYSVYNLDLANAYNGKISPNAGIQFDGFTDTTRTDVSSGYFNETVPSGQQYVKLVMNAGGVGSFSANENVLLSDGTNYERLTVAGNTTNHCKNSGFEVMTRTMQVFSDNMTGSLVWSGGGSNVSYAAGGVTFNSTVTLTTGNINWTPLFGSSGSNLALTTQATFKTTGTLPAVTVGSVGMQTTSGNSYMASLHASGTFLITRNGTTLASVSGSTPATNSSYTITLSLDNYGNLTANLYSGVTATGTALQTISASDMTLTGGFYIALTADAGILCSNAKVTAPFPDVWTGVGSYLVAWAVTKNAIHGTYSVTGVGVPGQLGMLNQSISTVATPAILTVSGYVASSGATGNNGYIELDGTGAGTVVQTTKLTGTNAAQRYSTSFTAVPSSTTTSVNLSVAGVGTFTFDSIQVEVGSAATTYVRNNNTSSSTSAVTFTTPLQNSYTYGAIYRTSCAIDTTNHVLKVGSTNHYTISIT